MKHKVLMAASVASMIDQFNMPNIRLMQELGYEVHTACNFKEGNTCDSRRIRKLEQELEGMHVFRHQWDCPRSMRPIGACMLAYRQMRKLMREHAFSWVHCQSPVGGALARIAARRAGIPVIYTAHGFHFYKGAPLKNWLLYYPAEKLLAHWTDVLVTVNREDCRLARRRLRAGKVCYTPGAGIDVEKYAGRADPAGKPPGAGAGRARECGRREFRRKYRIPEDAAVLLSVGELSRRKNHRAVLEALAALERKDVYYIICGQGERKEALMRRAENLGVAGRVRLTGYLEDLDALYRSADIFVFPSLQEGLPAALVEAMAYGLPCVVSDIRGNRELIGRGIKPDGAGTGCCYRTSIQKKRLNGLAAFGGCDRKAVEKAGGIRFSLKRPQQLHAALELLLEDGRLREGCGMRNKRKSRGYALLAVQPVMKKIYAQMAGQEGKGMPLCR